MMIKTTDDGSAPLIEALVPNRPKAVKKALADKARRTVVCFLMHVYDAILISSVFCTTSFEEDQLMPYCRGV